MDNEIKGVIVRPFFFAIPEKLLTVLYRMNGRVFPFPANMLYPFSPEEIAAEGLKIQEYEDIVHRLGRHPNKARTRNVRSHVV